MNEYVVEYEQKIRIKSIVLANNREELEEKIENDKLFLGSIVSSYELGEEIEIIDVLEERKSEKYE